MHISVIWTGIFVKHILKCFLANFRLNIKQVIYTYLCFYFSGQSFISFICTDLEKGLPEWNMSTLSFINIFRCSRCCSKLFYILPNSSDAKRYFLTAKLYQYISERMNHKDKTLILRSISILSIILNNKTPHICSIHKVINAIVAIPLNTQSHY